MSDKKTDAITINGKTYESLEDVEAHFKQVVESQGRNAQQLDEFRKKFESASAEAQALKKQLEEKSVNLDKTRVLEQAKALREEGRDLDADELILNFTQQAVNQTASKLEQDRLWEKAVQANPELQKLNPAFLEPLKAAVIKSINDGAGKIDEISLFDKSTTDSDIPSLTDSSSVAPRKVSKEEVSSQDLVMERLKALGWKSSH